MTLAAKIRTVLANPAAISETLVLASLVWSFLILTCVSLILVSEATSEKFHISYDAQNALAAWFSIVVLGATMCIVFAVSEFSFGYLASFYFLSVFAGYLWLSYFTPLEYDHLAARVSASISFVAFLIPAVTIKNLSIRSRALTARQMDILAVGLLVLIAVVVAYAVSLGFGLASPTNEALRSQLDYPKWIDYLISISASTLIPFIFAWFCERNSWLLVSASLIVGAAIYPVSLTKSTFATPLWLLTLWLLLKCFRVRVAVILTLLAPLLIGILAFGVEPADKKPIFGLINIRMLAIPASALDHYYQFFATHPLTHFCQITLIGKLFHCSLPEQLGVEMAKAYGLGNYNGSLFATEGIASLGVLFAPLAALACGLIISLGNAASSGLRPSFIFLSSAILIELLMNVPLSVILVTHGGILMFLLWFVCPRTSNA
jgi:hypothetical protein